MSDRISLLVFESRLPVGSSAKTIVGRLTRARPMAAALLEPDLAHQLGHPFLVRLFARESEREDDVLLCVQHREQVEELEDEADVLSPKERQLVVVQV
jgi:D-alanyl-D-alanine dipeptidase